MGKFYMINLQNFVVSHSRTVSQPLFIFKHLIPSWNKFQPQLTVHNNPISYKNAYEQFSFIRNDRVWESFFLNSWR